MFNANLSLNKLLSVNYMQPAASKTVISTENVKSVDEYKNVLSCRLLLSKGPKCFFCCFF